MLVNAIVTKEVRLWGPVTFEDIVGNPDDTDGEKVILALVSIGSPEEAGTVGKPLKGGAVGKELFAEIVRSLDEAEMVGRPPEGGTVGNELFAEIVGVLDGAEEAPIVTDVPAKGIEVIFTVWGMEMLPEGLRGGPTLDVAFVVPFGNPLISSALIVR